MTVHRSVLRRLLPAFACLAAALPALLPADAASAKDLPAESIAVPGLQKPAQILVDRWGVPHIYAASEADAFFVQGFNAARDRLFQIDLWRRRGLGQLAEVYGPNYVEQDRAARLFLYRGSMQDEWKAYGKDAQAIATRFAAGINAWIDYVAKNPRLLPPEFQALRYQPAKWKPEDVVRIRSHGIALNLKNEVARASVACKSGLAAYDVRTRLSPPWTTRVPEGLDPCLPDKVLDVFTLATQNVLLMPRDLPLAQNAPARDGGPVDDSGEVREGSNNWVVSAARSATGRPILANDPHRAYSTPSLRYLAHLSAPGMDVIGAGEPGLPGISIGHNGRIAFGLTIFSIDQEDLYVYELNPADKMQYRYGKGWEKFRVLRESIAVRGGPPVTVELLFTRHGPVIYREEGKRAFAVRTVWLSPGTAPYFGSIDYMKARDFDGFLRAMRRWGGPPENQVYADTAGNIGWVAGGMAPRRPNWDGLLPVPGDGRYEWQGFLPGEKLPHVLNPKKGWFATANEMNLPEDYPYKEAKLGFEWPDAFRVQRIGEALASKPKATLEDMMRLQNDIVSVPALRMAALLKTQSPTDPAAREAAKLLTSWDGRETADSPAAALFELWWSRHLGPAFKTAMVGEKAAALMSTPDSTAMLEALEAPATRFGADAEARRNRLLADTLAAAWHEAEKLLGSDPKQWQWGKLHQVYFGHAFAPVVDPRTRSIIDVGPLPAQGSTHTINQAGYRPPDFLQVNGPSVRLVLDVGGWDNSRAVNVPGQSGDPASPHYRDLLPLWTKGEYFPLLYTRAAVEAAAERRIDLVPAR